MKKLIAIEDTNKDIITAAIQEAEGNKVRERKITYDNMLYAVKQIEKRLNLPKKYLNGIQVDVDLHSAHFPNCYKGTPESTHFTIIFKSGKWKLVEVYRSKCGLNPDRKYYITLTEEAKQEIISRRLREVEIF